MNFKIAHGTFHEYYFISDEGKVYPLACKTSRKGKGFVSMLPYFGKFSICRCLMDKPTEK